MDASERRLFRSFLAQVTFSRQTMEPRRVQIAKQHSTTAWHCHGLTEQTKLREQPLYLRRCWSAEPLEPRKVRCTSVELEYERWRCEDTETSERKHRRNLNKRKRQTSRAVKPKCNGIPADGLTLEEREIEAKKLMEDLNMTLDRPVSISEAFALYIEAKNKVPKLSKQVLKLYRIYLATVLLRSHTSIADEMCSVVRADAKINLGATRDDISIFAKALYDRAEGLTRRCP